MAPAVLGYAAFRDTIKDGDCLLFERRGPVAWIIRFTGRSSFSHAGMALWIDGDRLMVAESRELRGCRIVPLSDAVVGSRVWLYRPVGLFADILDRKALRAAALDRLGQPYGYGAIMRIALSKLPLLGAANALGLLQRLPLVGRWIPKWGQTYSEDDLEDPGRRLICSAYVALCWRLAGVDLVPSLADRSTEPGDLARSAALQRVGLLA